MAAHTQHLLYLYHWAEIHAKGGVFNIMDPLQQNRDFCGDNSSKVFHMIENEDPTEIQLSL